MSLAVLPLVLAYLIGQRYFIQGLTAGAVNSAFDVLTGLGDQAVLAAAQACWTARISCSVG
jgi:hypothetical protein